MTNTTATDLILRSESARPGFQSYEVVRFYLLGSDILKVLVHRDNYVTQSYACVQIMSADRKWTTLNTLPAQSWFSGTPHFTGMTEREILAALEPLADELINEAFVILLP